MLHLLRFIPLLLIVTMLDTPPGFIMADPTSGYEATPKITDDPEGGEQAFLMSTPNCFLMADGTERCADPISDRALALLKFKSQKLAIRVIQHNPAVALSVCFHRTVRS